MVKLEIQKRSKIDENTFDNLNDEGKLKKGVPLSVDWTSFNMDVKRYLWEVYNINYSDACSEKPSRSDIIMESFSKGYTVNQTATFFLQAIHEKNTGENSSDYVKF
jgi:hypothetical protein